MHGIISGMLHESETVEYKESLSERDEGGECIVGFANKNGGELYFGVRNNKEVAGISDITEKTTRELSQLYVDNTEPKIIPKIEVIKLSGLNVIKITISKSTTPYHTYKRKPFIRVASETKAMPQDEYQRRLIAYKELNQDFSAKKVDGAELSDLAPKALIELRGLLKSSGRFKVNIDKLSDEQLLKDLQLLQGGKLTIAAIVLLAKESALSRLMPYVEIRYSYKITESDTRTQDIEIFNGGYLLYYNKIWEKINARNLTLSVPQGMLIREVKAFDEESIREAINNAIIHRDYYLNESIFVSQYQQRIEIKSPGGLVGGVTIENILDESKTRNKLIADTLFKIEFVEHLGNGVNLMFKNQLSFGKNPPNYSHTNQNNVKVELDGKITDVDFAKYVFNVANKKNRELSDKELILLNRIKENKRVNASYITDNMLEIGLIEKVGYGKYFLSRNYYDDTNRLGEYTRNRGLSKEENKMLILKHLKSFDKGFKKDLIQVLPSLQWHQIYRLLLELRKDKKIDFIGDRRSHSGKKAGYWKSL